MNKLKLWIDRTETIHVDNLYADSSHYVHYGICQEKESRCSHTYCYMSSHNVSPGLQLLRNHLLDRKGSVITYFFVHKINR